MEDMDGCVVTGRCHERVFGMVVDAGYSFLVESHRFVRFAAEVQIKAK
jgi:hypothetical protein